MKLISLVVPCLNEELALPFFYDEVAHVAATLTEYNFEFIFIDDGSRDNTLNILKELHERDSRVKYLSLSRNFGKESALYAGLSEARGDYIAALDADLQHPPSYLPQMLEIVNTGEYDRAALRCVNRKNEPLIRSFFAKCFYKTINAVSQAEIVDGAKDYCLMTRRMLDAILLLCEYNRFSRGIFEWVGFNTYWIEYENVVREHGETKWSFWRLFKYAINGIIAFSATPLFIAFIIGVLFCLMAVLGFVYCFAGTFLPFNTANFLLVSCVVFIGGVQLICLGIAGMYISTIYFEVKNRPLYILKEKSE